MQKESKRGLSDRLRQSFTVFEATKGNALFLKNLEAVYGTSRKLKREVTNAPNTKREIKALVANLGNATKGLLK